MMEAKNAILGNCADITTFAYGGTVIRFRTSNHLLRYTKILEWDNGYIVVMAKYDNSSTEEEEYIDLIPILENLYMESDKFLNDIEGVCLNEA